MHSPRSQLGGQIRIDAICNAFEEDWCPEHPPSLQSYLAQIELQWVDELLRDLLYVDIELRRKHGLSVDGSQYQEVHPSAPDVAEQLLREIQSALDPTMITDETEVVVRKSEGKSESASKTIGDYKLIRQIGQGGMGTVWIAEQSRPIQRQVAVKVIRGGIDCAEVSARFEAERQALALMNHPNIARILEAGTTDDGRPYFAMELVHGQPLTKYCDTKRLAIDIRLRLFAQICFAIQHAHQKGVVHRDIKPSNVLVAEVDGKPVPKVIDFGLAKALDNTRQLTDKSLFTGMGQILGTLRYMSPEQAALNTADIDTRTDIYSLGVILYELLTGNTPLGSRSRRDESLLKVLQQIREQEPVRPSQYLAKGNYNSEILAQRQTDFAELHRDLAGDLDWIVIKALEKECGRRYQSATEFGEDIHRFLDCEPVGARPPTKAYRIGKFVRKNRVVVTAAVLLFVALLAGIFGTTWGLIVAEQRAYDESLAREKADQRLIQLENSNEILAGIFNDLNLSRAKRQKSVSSVLAERLVDAGKQLGADTVGEPLATAKLQDRLASALRSLGYSDEAVGLSKQAYETRKRFLGHDHPDTLISLSVLALAYKATGNLERSIPLQQESLRLTKRIHGDDHRHTLVAMNNLAYAYKSNSEEELAGPLFQQLVEKTSGRSEFLPIRLAAMNGLAIIQLNQGKGKQAIPMFQEVLDLRTEFLGEKHLETLMSMANLADAYRREGDIAKAISLSEKCYQIKISELGRDHPQTIATLRDLADVYRINGDPRAVGLLSEAYQTLQKKLGPSHSSTLMAENLLGLAHQAAGDLEKAIPLFQDVLRIRSAKLGASHQATMISFVNLGFACEEANQFDESNRHFQKAFSLADAKLGKQHRIRLASLNGLALSHLSLGNYQLARQLFEEVYQLRADAFGEDHHDTLTSRNSLADTYLKLKNLDRSISLLEESLKLADNRFGRESSVTLKTIAKLGVHYDKAGRIEEAIPLLYQAYRARDQFPRLARSTHYLWRALWAAGRHDEFEQVLQEDLQETRNRLPAGSLRLANSLSTLGIELAKIGHCVQAESLLRESLMIQESLNSDSWRRFSDLSWLGYILAQQNRDDEAEPLLLSGYQQMKIRQSQMSRIGELKLLAAIERIISFYQQTAAPGQAAIWRERLQWERAGENHPPSMIEDPLESRQQPNG